MTRERKESTRRQKMWEARTLGRLDAIIAEMQEKRMVSEAKRKPAKAQLKTSEVDELEPA
jgi:hypothetical protein